MSEFVVETPAFRQGTPIPARFAFGQPGQDGPFALSDNISPALVWRDAPAGTRSFALLVVDPVVPSVGDDVNQPDREVPADLPRVEFFHWVLVDIPGDAQGLPEGAGGRGVTPRGKPLGATDFGLTGRNSYTDWFAGDEAMGGVYAGYDGPCPPWNDTLVHRYHFQLFALDVDSLGLSGDFDAAAVRRAMEGHVLGRAEVMGSYTMNRRLR